MSGSHAFLRLLAIAAIFLIAAPRLLAVAILQLRVIEGDGAVYAVGSRGTRGITVQVTDETGQPVEGAAVSFSLPKEGPGGTFSDGATTALFTTKADGKVSVWGMQWNRTPGEFEVRITAVKDRARAGIVCQQVLSDKITARAGGEGTFNRPRHLYKWLLIGLAAGGGALGAAAFAQGRSSHSSGVAPPVATTIGQPSITIGHP